ncbi:MAG: EamA family transporter, partial [Candidatus Marinimicrobia bacterium]|nr:EamA family transporter [Candidatus Neomarinimicrobiota bacterium]
DWVYLLLLGIFQLGLSYILYAEAIKHITALSSILIAMIEPILNPLWVLLIIGEVPGSWAVVGGVIILGTVTLRAVREAGRA